MRTRRLLPVTKISPKVRLYLLLSWLVISFYAILVSRGSTLIGLSDLETTQPETVHQSDVSELLCKSLNELNTCPIVRLYGVANSNISRKKARVTNLLSFICQNFISLLQMLRSCAVISAMLTRAGDVELNPGPPPPPLTSPTQDNIIELSSRDDTSSADQLQASNTSLNLESKPCDSKTLSNEPPISAASPNDIPVHGQTQALQETPSLFDIPIVRKVVAPEVQPIIAQTSEPQHFQRHETQNDDLTLSTVDHPPPQIAHKFPRQVQVELQPDKSLVVGIALPQVKPKEDDFIRCDFGELRRTGSCISLRDYNESHVERIGKSFERRDSLSDDQSLDDNQICFLVSANKLYRIGSNCEFCPICCKRKERQIMSHIFPCGLLKVFKRIHCSDAKDKFKDFIYDFSRGRRMGSRKLYYPILCEECEKLCDEQSLRELYIFVMDKPNKSFKVPNDDCWLQYVLANIMFRGLLVADNLSENLQTNNFKQTFNSLWRYCKTRKSMPALQLFLLRNRPWDEELIMFMYPFEYVLRCPMFSTVVRDKELGIDFIYTKFDCFHLVLPLDDKSKDYFNHFHNGFDTYEDEFHRNHVDLRWTVQCASGRKFDRETKAVKYYISEQVKPYLFPEVLLKVVLQQYGRWVSMIYSHPESSDHDLASHCKIMIEHHPGLNHDYPTRDFMGVIAEEKPQTLEQPSDPIKFDRRLPEEKLSEMIKNAAMHSPLGLQQRKVDKLREEIDELKEEVETKTTELKEVTKVVAHFRTALDIAEKDVKKERKLRLSLERDLTQRDLDLLSTENAYEERLTKYSQRLEIVHSLLFKEQRELNRYRLENVELKRQCKAVENNLYEALIQISDGLEKIREQTNFKVCDKLLHQCQLMKSMIMRSDTALFKALTW